VRYFGPEVTGAPAASPALPCAFYGEAAPAKQPVFAGRPSAGLSNLRLFPTRSVCFVSCGSGTCARGNIVLEHRASDSRSCPPGYGVRRPRLEPSWFGQYLSRVWALFCCGLGCQPVSSDGRNFRVPAAPSVRPGSADRASVGRCPPAPPHLDSASTAARSTSGVTSTRRTGEAAPLDQPESPAAEEAVSA
jgi:hypothetical protein